MGSVKLTDAEKQQITDILHPHKPTTEHLEVIFDSLSHVYFTGAAQQVSHFKNCVWMLFHEIVANVCWYLLKMNFYWAKINFQNYGSKSVCIFASIM